MGVREGSKVGKEELCLRRFFGKRCLVSYFANMYLVYDLKENPPCPILC